ncbi:MAG: transporter [Rhizobiales bacterium 65-9]|nr:AEC family transporter [Hyphomicrobiales bacterium]OJY37384.1 MAG: transporter [Rhizobiales bacterium 65-9]
MLSLAALVIPVFALIGLGYAARVTRYVSDRTGDGLSEFIFAVAVPMLIFKTLSSATLPAAQPWGYWISYFAGVFIVWGLATFAAGRLFHLSQAESTVAGFVAGQANTVMMGIPMILAAFGEDGAAPLFLLIAIHLPIVMSVATVQIEGRNAHLGQTFAKLARNPIVVAVIAGAVARLIGYSPSGVIKTVVDLLAQASTPCALFAMGVALHRYGLRGGWRLPALVTALKLAVHPLIVFVLARHVFSMPPVWSGVAVLFASCPCGVNAYLFAERYKAGASLASSSIAISTSLSIVSIVFWLWMLGVHLN